MNTPDDILNNAARVGAGITEAGSKDVDFSTFRDVTFTPSEALGASGTACLDPLAFPPTEMPKPGSLSSFRYLRGGSASSDSGQLVPAEKASTEIFSRPINLPLSTILLYTPLSEDAQLCRFIAGDSAPRVSLVRRSSDEIYLGVHADPNSFGNVHIRASVPGDEYSRPSNIRVSYDAIEKLGPDDEQPEPVDSSLHPPVWYRYFPERIHDPLQMLSLQFRISLRVDGDSSVE